MRGVEASPHLRNITLSQGSSSQIKKLLAEAIVLSALMLVQDVIKKYILMLGHKGVGIYYNVIVIP